jgi:NADPH:quinone reductase-like Zn-dependent oxidoreductase
MTEQMRAVRQTSLGGPEVLDLVEVPVPAPGPTRVRVRVHAAGVNPTDWKMREAGYWNTLPFGQGWDVSGVVAARGATR